MSIREEWRGLVYEVRMLLAERLLGLAVVIAPRERAGIALKKLAVIHFRMAEALGDFESIEEGR